MSAWAAVGLWVGLAAGCLEIPDTGLCGNFKLNKELGEECDLGAAEHKDPATALPGQCTWECKIQPGCGDGKIDNGADEQCDGDEWCSDECRRIEGCGNRVIETGEECDKDAVPADKPGATCTDECELIWCGDGNPRPGELCDDGNLINEDACTNACEPATCSDGFVQPGEACDDGNTVDDDKCTNDCELPSVCGNGEVEGDEPCDDGNPYETDECLNDCRAAGCGDGKVWAAMEACDDANEDETDSCLKDCTAAGCGDGFVWAGMEACDDGNEDETDACRNDCTLANCGDGVVWVGVEDCDDKDLDDLDECNNDCAAPRFVFVTSTSGNLGALGGVAGANAHCQSLATDAGLLGTYAAWLTDGDKTTEPAQRFKSTEFKGWYILPTKTRVARGWTDLTTPNEAKPMDYLQAAITATEKGAAVIAPNVWTNTLVDGTQASPAGHCVDWTSESDTDFGQAGLAKPGVLGAAWTVEAPYKCNFGLRLYCFEVAP